MSAILRPDPAHDAALSDFAALLRADMDKLDGIAEALKAVHFVPQAAGLSVAEQAIAAQSPPKREQCILERDAELVAGGLTIGVTLRAYGRFHKAHPGESGGRGELPVSPPEPAGFSVDRVTLGGPDGEDEIYGCLSSDDLDAIADAAYEDAQ